MYIREVGIASPLGLGKAASVQGWMEGARGLSPNPMPTGGLPQSVAGIVPGFSPRKQLPDRKAVKLMSREAQLLVYAAVEACGGTTPAETLGVDAELIGGFAAAGYEVTPLDDVLEMFRQSRDPEAPSRLSLAQLFAKGRAAYNPLSPLKTLPNMALFHAATTLGLRGPHLALGSSPAAGLAALSGALDAMADGACEYAVVGGADAQLELYRLHYLQECGVLDGSAPGEGAAALLLGPAGDVRIAAIGLGQEPPLGPMPRDAYSTVSDDGVARSALYVDVLDRAAEAGAPSVDTVFADLWGLSARDAAERSAVHCALDRVKARSSLLESRSRVGHLGAAHGLFDVALAAELIRAGKASSVLVTAGGVAGDLGAVVLCGGAS